jgi:hypothetical protein
MSGAPLQRGNFGSWAWWLALLPMALCGSVTAALFVSGLVTMRPSNQDQKLQTAQRRLTSTSGAATATMRIQATRQVLGLTATAFAITRGIPQLTLTSQTISSRGETATAQVVSLDEQRRWTRAFADPFEMEQGWITESLGGTEGVTRTLENGKYIWKVKSVKGNIHVATINPTFASSKFYLSVEVQTLGVARLMGGGLIFRKTNSDFYYFGVEGGQTVAIGISHNNQWTPLWLQARPDVLLNAANHLEVMGDGSYYVFFLNGRMIYEMSDSRLSAGAFGVSMRPQISTNESIIAFDDFELRLPALTATPTPTPTVTPTPLP